MEIQNFEQELMEMTKPEVVLLKHQDMLSNAIITAKDKSVVSWWWLCAPLYITAMLLMKSAFMPHTTLLSNIEDLKHQQPYMSFFFFIAAPLVLILVNFISIRKIHFLSGSPKSLGFLQSAWLNGIMIILSVIVLIIYLL